MPAGAKNMIGLRFGYLTVVDRVKNRGGRAAWLCQCDCGGTKEVVGVHLRRGFNISCGHLRNLGRSAIERFEEFYIPEPNSGCWLWTSSAGRNGYGKFFADGRVTEAHRYSYKTFKGPIPDGLYVLHRCDVRSCVNPDHLWLGTAQENTADCIRKGRARWQRRAA